MFNIKRSCFVLFFLVFFINFFSFSLDVSASTTVIDDIEIDTTWTLSDSPYIIQNDIMVYPGAKLTIEPGVVVKLAPSTRIDILGSLSSKGTVDNHIYFTSLWDDSVGGDTNGDGNQTTPNLKNNKGLFYGIYFYSAENVYLKNSDISFSLNGFYFWSTDASISDIKAQNNHHDLNIWEGSNISLSGGDFYGSLYESVYLIDSVLVGDHITIDNAQNFQGYITSNSDLYLTDSVIQNIHGQAIGAEGPGVINLERLEIKNTDDLVGYEGIILNVKDSILDNTKVVTWGGATSNIDNVIIKNNSGIFDLGDSTFNITKSKIVNNDYGIYVYSDTNAANSIYNISDTTISDNTQYGAYNKAAYLINLKNVWWGNASGPYNQTFNPDGVGNEVSDNVLFDPWLTSDPFEGFCTVDCFSNVLFLPGLESSRLYAPRVDGSEDQLWEPNANSDVEALYLNTDGTSKSLNIYTRDIIRETNTPFPMGSAGQNIYKSFVNMLGEMVDDFKIANYELYAYDWRQSVGDIANSGTKYQDDIVSLTDTLQSLINSSKSGKVTIIAHSNGGLLAKALLKKLQNDKNAGVNNLIDNVDVLILVAVPEIGTASAVPAILHGYDQRILGGWLIDETRARELGRNMLGAYGLLPSEKYIDHISASPATFVDTVIPSGVTTDMVQTFNSAINSYLEYKDFLFGNEGRTNPSIDETNLPINLSPSLFAQAESLHNNIDTWTPPTGMRVIEVAGWGLDTVASFEYYPKCISSTSLGCNFILDERPRFTSDGDKTVIVPSAQYMSSSGKAEKYWVDLNKFNRLKFPRVNHASILEANPLLTLISNTIQELPSENSQYLSTDVPLDTSNRLRVSIHSPVTIDAYGIDGSHTGKICPPASDFCYLEENILNSSYLEFGEGKYINLPEDQMLKIKIQGTDVGTFIYDSEKVLPDGTSTVSSFIDIPVTTQTQAEVTINNGTGLPQLALDVTGDGVADFTLTPNATFDPITYLQIMKTTMDSLDIPQSKIKTFDKRISSIIKSIQEGKVNKSKLTAEKFKSTLEKTLTKSGPKNPKPKKLSKADAQLLLDILNKLLDNIS